MLQTCPLVHFHLCSSDPMVLDQYLPHPSTTHPQQTVETLGFLRKDGKKQGKKTISNRDNILWRFSNISKCNTCLTLLSLVVGKTNVFNGGSKVNLAIVNHSKQLIKGSLVNFNFEATSVSIQDVIIMVTCPSKVVQWFIELLSVGW